MKKTILYGMLILAGAALSSCDDFLNDNRYPLANQSDSPAFWNNEVNVQGQVNNLYNYLFAYGNTTARNGTFYFESRSDDQVGTWGSGVEFNNWNYLQTPGSNSNWNNAYDRIRNCNYIINNMETTSLEAVKAEAFSGEARIMRAWFYYDLVRKFGDVPMVLTVLDPSSSELYMARTPRNEVMDQALKDLDYAIAHITRTSAKTEFSVDLAYAVKVELALFEASYAKYHQKDDARATKLYNEVIAACQYLMGAGYELCENYADLYNSTYGSVQGIPSLLTNKEVIFMKPYKEAVKMHSLVKYTNTGEILGMSRDAFESYLFLDGKPMSQQADKMETGVLPMTTNDKGEQVEAGQFNIKACIEVRDKRLAATIDTVVFYENYGWNRPVNGTSMTSKSGYGVKKFYNDKLNLYQATTDGQSFTCAPLYWLAEIYLAYAEAKAELGTITDADLNLTINKLYKRAGLPEQTVAGLNAINDQANNMNVSSLLWEIRRCRRCELMFDKGQRYWDLVRWHQLEIMDNVKYPKTTQGAYIAPIVGKHFAKNTDGYLDIYKESTRVFTDREYFFPIGTNEITLNPAIKQNPGWDTPKAQ